MDPAVPSQSATTPAAPESTTSLQPASASTSFDVSTGPAAPPSKFIDSIPTEFRDRPYLKDVADMPSLLKKLDGAQQLIGKRPAGIPDDKAAPEDWAKFFKYLGRPDVPDEYELKGPNDVKMPPEMEKNIRALFHKTGMTKKQASAVFSGYMDLLAGDKAAVAKQKADTEASFDKLTKETFGADQDKALERARSMINKYAPNFRGHLDKASNEVLVALAATIQGIHRDYIKEDGLSTNVSSGFGDNESTLRSEARVIMASPEFQSKMHPGHAQAAQKLKDIYARVNRLQGVNK